MNLSLYAEKIPLEYFIVRRYIVALLDAKSLSVHDRNFLYPLDNIDRQSLSLTDAIDPENQIRYFLSERTIRKVNELAKKISESEIKSVIVDPVHTRNVLMGHFIQALNRMEVEISFQSSPEYINNFQLTEKEELLVKEIVKGDQGDIGIIIKNIKQITNCGDVFTAEHLLEHGLKYFKNVDNVHSNLIGTIKNCVNKPIEAEYYYKKHKEIREPLALVRANYPLSMLYLRHHKPEKLDFLKGKEFLNEAYDYIMEGGIDSLELEDKNFYTVFNRNGYGLILFREGKVQEAIALLSWAVESLTSKSPKHHMHRSVILYNICQCYKKVSDYDSAIGYYKQLLEIDYSFPEYHLEMGLCYKEKGDEDSYVSCVNEALRINPYHSDSHYYYSLVLTENENLNQAELHAKIAWELSGDDTTAYNYAYVQSLKGIYVNLDKLQPNKSIHILPEWIILKAEQSLENSKDEAIQILRSGLSVYLTHPELKENLSIFEGLYSDA